MIIIHFRRKYRRMDNCQRKTGKIIILIFKIFFIFVFWAFWSVSSAIKITSFHCFLSKIDYHSTKMVTAPYRCSSILPFSSRSFLIRYFLSHYALKCIFFIRLSLVFYIHDQSILILFLWWTEPCYNCIMYSYNMI